MPVRISLSFILLVIFDGHVLSQSLTIEGKIHDSESNKPVPYASVGLLGYSLGTSSNDDGSFTIKIPSQFAKKFTLKISCVGYENLLLENPESPLNLKLKPSTTVLNEVVVLDKTLSPEGIVKEAFANIKKNYYTNSFLYQTFYRHYCKDDSVYGRLIEASVDIYKKKGYKPSRSEPGEKEGVKVTQLRRSFDYTKAGNGHYPIALYSVMGIDPVSYQKKPPSNVLFYFLNQHDVSFLKRKLKDFQIELLGTTQYDDENVYIIQYYLKKDTIKLGTGLHFRNQHFGKLYINVNNYAIVKSDFSKITVNDTLKTSTTYRKFNGKYFFSHSVRDGQNFNPRSKFRHYYHVELTTTDIVFQNVRPFSSKEPSKEELLQIHYDSLFWQNYNILKATPLEEKIVLDLQAKQNLSDQFKDFANLEKQNFLGAKADEVNFNQYLSAIRGTRPVYVDFWASWCGPCIAEMPASKQLVEKYKGKVAFVYLSIDDDPKAWQKAKERYKLTSPYVKHFRIGATSDLADIFEVNSIPRYLLIDKKGNYVNTNAERPSSLDIEKQLNSLLLDSKN